MTNIFYLILIILSLTGQNLSKKPYGDKFKGGGSFTFTFFVSIFAILFFALTAKNLSFNAEILPYAVLFAISYAAATFFSVVAVSAGSLSLTSVIISYSTLIPAFYGIIFLKNNISSGFFAGIIFLMISLFLINRPSKTEKISAKWLLYAFFAFVGNGLCSVFQNIQQIKFEGGFKNEFMIMSLAAVAIFMLAFALITERKNIFSYSKSAVLYGGISGILNGIVNLFVMILSARMSVSVMFPLISAGGVVATFVASKLLYKEKLSKIRLVGFAVGVISIIFLNI